MTTIHNVLVLGASGSVGPHIISALLSSPSNFKVSILTRESSKATFPTSVKVIRTDYSPKSLLSAFAGIDAIVSAIATFSTHQQATIIEAAIAADVKRFVPSEYGIDSRLPKALEVVPPVSGKVDTIKFLQDKEGTGLTWTAVIVGGFFDWVLAIPGLMGWNIPGRKATIYDGGDVEYEATNVDQIGHAVAAVLAAENLEETKNKYVFVNSFTTTQNKVLATLEKATGEKFEVSHVKAGDVSEAGLKLMETGEFIEINGGRYLRGTSEAITAAIYGWGGCNNFSREMHGDGSEPGLWNERLGLPEEKMEETIKKIVGGGK